MSLRSGTYLGIILCLLFTEVISQCEDWISIPPDEYSTQYVNVNSDDANTVRPLGFRSASYSFEGAPFCVRVNGVSGNMRHIEWAWDLEQSATLCIRNNVPDSAEKCASTQDSTCQTVPGTGDSIEYEFYCEGSNCEGGTKTFWYRFVVEDSVNGTYEENWCQDRSLNYPSSLLSVPTNLPPPTTTTKENSAESLFHFYTIYVLLFTGLITIFLQNC